MNHRTSTTIDTGSALERDVGQAVNGSGVSRQHAEFLREGPIFIVRDAGSRNRTWVDARREQLGELVFHISPQPQRLIVNGEPVEATTKSLVVLPGKVLLEAAAPGHTAVTTEVTVEQGTTLDVSLTLVPETAVAPPLVEPSPTPADIPPHAARTNRDVSEVAHVRVPRQDAMPSDANVAWWQHAWVYPAAGTVVFGGCSSRKPTRTLTSTSRFDCNPRGSS